MFNDLGVLISPVRKDGLPDYSVAIEFAEAAQIILKFNGNRFKNNNVFNKQVVDDFIAKVRHIIHTATNFSISKEREVFRIFTVACHLFLAP